MVALLQSPVRSQQLSPPHDWLEHRSLITSGRGPPQLHASVPPRPARVMEASGGFRNLKSQLLPSDINTTSLPFAT